MRWKRGLLFKGEVVGYRTEAAGGGYLECMDDYLSGKTEYGWYLCLDGNKIVGGLGVIENDFHGRKDLTPNICAVYTESEYRCKGVAGQLLDIPSDCTTDNIALHEEK